MEMIKYSQPEEYLTTYNIVIPQLLLELTPGVDPLIFREKLDTFCERLFSEEDQSRYYKLQPLRDVHLNPALSGISVPSSDPIYSYILAAIAIAVLLIACINFISLAIGRSSSRTREVGMRKVLGAKRLQLMRQHWGEALILSFLALCIAVVIAELFLPTFNSLAEKQLSLDIISDPIVVFAALIIVIITALIAGVYPALLLSKLAPVDSFRGNVKLLGKNRLIKGLVVLQFAISVLLIACTLIITAQINYVSSYKVGFDSNYVITFPTGTRGDDAADLLKRFKHILKAKSEIVSISGYSYNFGESWLYINYGGEGFKTLIGEDVTGPAYAEDPETADKYFYINWVDAHYITTMGMKLVQGRNFSDEYLSDLNGAIIINETAAKNFGWDNPINQKLPKGFKDAVVVGVVKDFNFYPLQREIQPLVMHMPRQGELSSIFQIAVRFNSGDVSGILTLLEDTWTEVSVGAPFQYEFMDERVAEQYIVEMRWKTIVEYSAVFTVLIACIGLFGLASLAVAKRTKEIGIRKVLGAGVTQMVALVSKEFTVLVIIANCIALPLAWYLMDKWLEGFAYRTQPGVLIFLVAGGLALLISMLSVSYQAFKAASSDPVKSLRYE